MNPYQLPFINSIPKIDIQIKQNLSRDLRGEKGENVVFLIKISFFVEYPVCIPF